MVDTKDILKLEFLSDKSSILKYKLSHGETTSESVYLERTLNPKETQRLVSRLSEIVDNYNKG
tara:strand:+ start:323 stop:511 length:189 start_codon:yes stop_codon:yes gene_type:complete